MDRSVAKFYQLLVFFFSVNKIFENLVINKLPNHFAKYGIISDFHYGFRSS